MHPPTYYNSRIIDDAWSTSLWFSKISWDPCTFDCSLIYKITLDCLSKTSIIWYHISCIFASIFGMLLDMSLRISNIQLICSDIVCCSSRLKLWYGLVMKNFEHDAKTDFNKGFFFWQVGWVTFWVMGQVRKKMLVLVKWSSGKWKHGVFFFFFWLCIIDSTSGM